MPLLLVVGLGRMELVLALRDGTCRGMVTRSSCVRWRPILILGPRFMSAARDCALRTNVPQNEADVERARDVL